MAYDKGYLCRMHVSSTAASPFACTPLRLQLTRDSSTVSSAFACTSLSLPLTSMVVYISDCTAPQTLAKRTCGCSGSARTDPPRTNRYGDCLSRGELLVQTANVLLVMPSCTAHESGTYIVKKIQQFGCRLSTLPSRIKVETFALTASWMLRM